jgi:hypothetical protein
MISSATLGVLCGVEPVVGSRYSAANLRESVQSVDEDKSPHRLKPIPRLPAGTRKAINATVPAEGRAEPIGGGPVVGSL